MRLSVITLALGVLLTGCGGGGGGDAPATAATSNGDVANGTNATVTQAAIDKGNYVQAATEAASSAMFMLDGTAVAVGVDSVSASDILKFGLDQVATLGSWYNGPATAAGVVQSTTANCALSGSITASVTDADNNNQVSAGDSITLTAVNCKNSASSTINGSLSLALTALTGNISGSVYNTSIKLTFKNLSIATSAGTMTGNGDISLAINQTGLNAGSQSMSSSSFSVTAAYTNATYSRTLKNFVAKQDTTPNLPASSFKTASTVQGSISSSALANKSLSISTIVPFVRLSNATYPSSGQAVLTGSTSAKVRLTAQSSTAVLIELDEDGDGFYELASSRLWSTIN